MADKVELTAEQQELYSQWIAFYASLNTHGTSAESNAYENALRGATIPTLGSNGHTVQEEATHPAFDYLKSADS